MKFKDVARYSELTLTGVRAQKSSNVGVSKLALAMPSFSVSRYLTHVWLGKATTGVGRRTQWFISLKNNGGPTYSGPPSFGYGLMVTPLQLARVWRNDGSYGAFIARRR
ncbi:hypothetical protein KCP75_25245 [Salmonella enterica subsp. enterica]|nr:hypothetical protein KCP75_25245 [Salmonella enterica subsp. enterica]